MPDRDSPDHFLPPEGAHGWTKARLRADSTGDTLATIRVHDQYERAYTLSLIRNAIDALMGLSLDSETDTQLWVLDGEYDGPLLVTTTRGVEQGDTVALVAPRTDGIEAPDSVEVETGSDMVPGRAHAVGLVRWPVWFGPPEDEEVPSDG